MSVSSLTRALESVSVHRDVVPVYFVRSANRFIITGVGKTNGGAIIVDDAGQIVRACSSKKDALAAIGCHSNIN